MIHQKNKGAAAARKNGIRHASGNYVCFVDADDWIQDGMIKFFVDNIGECDLITSGCHCEDSFGGFYVRMDSFEDGVYDTEERLRYFMENMVVFKNRFEDGVLPFLVNKMYRTDILKDVIKEIDTAIVYAEDRDLLFHYILRVEKIRVVHKSFSLPTGREQRMHGICTILTSSFRAAIMQMIPSGLLKRYSCSSMGQTWYFSHIRKKQVRQN